MDRVVFEGVGKRYGKQWALRAVNAHFAQGEIVMVIGPNGSGKTTLIKCLLGLVRPTEGAIQVNGTAVARPLLPRGDRLHAAARGVPSRADGGPTAAHDERHPRCEVRLHG
ncbi:MAG: ATP-binding cassette domain-containing protein [Flavobacteriales bacterium]|nr:ATP-binding cassette domain-containing protein [Flavobacteriales bacterium]